MNIVIIAYRPDHTDVCRGCRMGSTESDMEYGIFDNHADAANFLAKFLFQNSISDSYEYSNYEFSYIINGMDCEDLQADVELYDRQRIQGLASIEADSLVDAHKNKQQITKDEKLQKQQEDTKRRELETLKTLQEKYEP